MKTFPLLNQEYPVPTNFELCVEDRHYFYGVAPNDIDQAIDWAFEHGITNRDYLTRIETDLISGQNDRFGSVRVEWL